MSSHANKAANLYVSDVTEDEDDSHRYGDSQVLEADGPAKAPEPRGDAEACRPGCHDGCCPSCKVGGQSAAYYRD